MGGGEQLLPAPCLSDSFVMLHLKIGDDNYY